MTKAKKITAAVLAAASLLSVTACGGGGRSNTTQANTADSTTAAPATTPETFDTDAAVQEAITHIEVDKTLNPTKKIKWLSWYPIDETAAPLELFKANYGIPEEGDESYGDYANSVISYVHVAYGDRYDSLGKMVASGDSPDVMQFEICNFPLGVYKSMYQPIDGIIDTYAPEWADTREIMDKFMWNGKNYCAITEVNTSYLWFYRRSVAEEAGLEDPYELYKKGEWTWDKFLEMADKFQQTGDTSQLSDGGGKYIINGYGNFIASTFLCTTGVPLVGYDNGLLKSNLFDSNIERGMNVLETLCKEEYRYPGEKNGWSPMEKEWAAGNILFMTNGTWFYSETAQKYMRKNKWDEDDIFFVPVPKDPNADAYYQEMKVDPYMFIQGSDNVDGFKALVSCQLYASKDPEVKAAQREKDKRDSYWTDEQLDFIDELKSGVFSPVFDYRNGISAACADTTSGTSPTDMLICYPLQNPDYTYTQLRGEYTGEIDAAINELNEAVS